MKVIGVTGGIGSGKSTVCKLIKNKGHLVYDMDNAGKRISDSNTHIIEKTKELFGDDIYDENIKLKRKVLGNIVFNNKDLLSKLSELIHPYIREDFNKWVIDNNQHDLLFVENAILFESGFNDEVDEVIMIYYPEDLRIKRVMVRDNCSEECVRSRMKNQWGDLKKIELSDYVLFSLDNMEYCEIELDKTLNRIKNEN